MPFCTVEGAGPYKMAVNFLMRTSLYSPFSFGSISEYGEDEF